MVHFLVELFVISFLMWIALAASGSVSVADGIFFTELAGFTGVSFWHVFYQPSFKSKFRSAVIYGICCYAAAVNYVLSFEAGYCLGEDGVYKQFIFMPDLPTAPYELASLPLCIPELL
jgi:hypothetical protein